MNSFGIAISLCCRSYLLMTVWDKTRYKFKCFVMFHYEEHVQNNDSVTTKFAVEEFRQMSVLIWRLAVSRFELLPSNCSARWQNSVISPFGTNRVIQTCCKKGTKYCISLKILRVCAAEVIYSFTAPTSGLSRLRCGVRIPTETKDFFFPFSHRCRQTQGPTQLPIQWVLVSFPGDKAAGVWCRPRTLV